MTTEPDHPALTEALAAFETSLPTPFVPGELESWVRDARDAVSRFDPLLRTRLVRVHDPELQQIATEDPDLLSRVEDLREGDRRSLADLASLRRTLDSLDVLAPEREPFETKLEGQLDELVRQGLDFVLHVRRQEVALRTWLQEAYDRDRGTLD